MKYDMSLGVLWVVSRGIRFNRTFSAKPMKSLNDLVPGIIRGVFFCVWWWVENSVRGSCLCMWWVDRGHVFFGIDSP